MAWYRYPQYLKQSGNSNAYESEHTPGEQAPHAGIYRCKHCNFEIAIAQGHTLPSDHHHDRTTAVRWILTVYAQHTG